MDKINSASKQNGDSQVEKWWNQVRSQTMRQLQLETAMSLPVPIDHGGKLYLGAFYFGVRHKGGPGSSVVMPPVARITASYPDAHLLSFQHKQTGDLFPGLSSAGELGPAYIDVSTPRERVEQRKFLFTRYAQIIELFRSVSEPTETLREFSDLFSRVAEVPLMPYYQAINPAFFAWLGHE